VRFAVRVGACWICRATFTVGVTFVGADAAVARVSTLIRATVVRFAVVRGTGAIVVDVTFVREYAWTTYFTAAVFSTFVVVAVVVGGTGAITVGVTFVGADAAVARVVTVVVSTFVTCTTGIVVADTGKRWVLYTRVVYAAGIFARTVGVNKALGARLGTVGVLALARNVAF
jgi:hypothetical protein